MTVSHLERRGEIRPSSETSHSPIAISIDGGAVLVHTAIAPDQANVARLFTRAIASAATDSTRCLS